MAMAASASTWIWIGAGVAAVAAVAGAGYYEHKKHAQAQPPGPTPNPAGTLTAPKPYVAATAMVGGNTYLVSIPPIGGKAAADVAKAINLSPGALATASWDTGAVPAGWPGDDADPNRQRFVVALAQGGVPITFPGLKLYTAGQTVAASQPARNPATIRTTFA